MIKVQLVDDDPDDRFLYKELFEAGNFLSVETINPLGFTELEQYSELVSSDVKALLVDYFVSDRAGAGYNGIEIAKYLRKLNKKIPIFIITNIEKINTEGTESVESIISKDGLADEISIHITRILRAAGRYSEAQNEESRELNELVNKKVAGNISATELLRLNEIRSEIESLFNIPAALAGGAVTTNMEEQLELLKQISTLLQNSNGEDD